MSDVIDLLRSYVHAHNEGVRTDNFAAMLALFTHDAVFEFIGLDVGPFEGIASIANAFDQAPPTDELIITEPLETASTVMADYAWTQTPEHTAGSMRMHGRAGQIARLTIRTRF